MKFEVPNSITSYVLIYVKPPPPDYSSGPHLQTNKANSSRQPQKQNPLAHLLPLSLRRSPQLLLPERGLNGVAASTK
jgi:hypothetical protein